MISTTLPFVPSINSGRALSSSKDSQRFFQQNHTDAMRLGAFNPAWRLNDTQFGKQIAQFNIRLVGERF